MTTPYHVITEPTGWSYIVKPDGSRDGPCRYRWEADQVADEMNKQATLKAAHDHPEA